MGTMNKYLLLLLILTAGFIKSDIQTEKVYIAWHESVEPENKLGYTFTGAGYDPESMQLIPMYFRDFPLSHPGQDFQFLIENIEYTVLNISDPDIHLESLPSEPVLKKSRLKSGEHHKLEIRMPVVIRQGEKLMLVKAFDLKIIPVSLKSASQAAAEWKNESVLKDGKWIKISTSERGIYKIPYSTLQAQGFSSPAQVKVFGAGGMILPEDPGTIPYDDLPQLAVWHGTNNGSNCIFFYAPGNVDWIPNQSGTYLERRLNPYAGLNYFFLTEEAGIQKDIQLLDEIPEAPTHILTAFDELLLEENDQYNLISSGREWYGDHFARGTSRNYTLTVTDAEPGTNLTVRIKAAARSSTASEMIVTASQQNIGKVSFNGVNTSDNNGTYAYDRSTRLTVPAPSGNLNLGIRYAANGATPEAWLDFIELHYRRRLRAGNEPLFFRDLNSVGTGNTVEFNIEGSSSNTVVWDVTNPFEVQQVPLQLSGSVATGRQSAVQLREYVVFNTNGSFPEPEWAGEVANQNLHGIDTPDFLIVTHSAFLSQANELANFHRSVDGMNVEVVSVNQIYNEFSSGNRDATGIRNFIKMLYDRNEGLKYVLLFGDGTYDNRGIKGNAGFIPTYQSENSLSIVNSFVTDDYFVLLDAGESVIYGSIDLGIGRIPASTVYEAELSVRKIKQYHSAQALGNWRNVLCFIGDDEDNTLHMSDSEKLANQVNEKHGEFIIDKIYFDAYRQVTGPGGESYPEVTQAINDRVKEGTLLLNYVGHANDRFLSDEKVLDISHINSWSNSARLPIFVTATCEFSRFDADHTSAGEYIFFNPNGGGIGLFSTTRVVYASSNYMLSQSFYRFVFEKDEFGKPYRMGDIMRLAKINTTNASVVNKRNFTLLANPALRLSYPQHRVITTSVNGSAPQETPDTIGSLQMITITGYVADEYENKIEDFSGKITSTVFDKPVMKKTRGNAGEPQMEFKVQENIIYQGTAEVTDGDFSFSFVVPKDISYNPGNGKIVYYAENEIEDAHGVFENFVIGGSGSAIPDNQGPQIQLYLDSPDFVSGGKVSKNPLLIAHLSDENGINMVGSGIGHDITAVLNDDYSNTMVLNNYYRSNLGDHASGTLEFPLKDIPVGHHTLRLKVWDVANNSSEAEIEFEVTDDFYIQNVSNYPNPVNGYTFFTFEHNLADASFNVLFEIFDQNGSKIDSFIRNIGSASRVSNPVRWDLSESRVQLRGGIYPYRITVQSPDGQVTSGSGKMIVAQ